MQFISTLILNTNQLSRDPSKHPLISQIFIWGSSFESYNVAIIVPEKDEFIKTFKCDSNNFGIACNDNGNRTRFIEIINDFGRQNGLKGFEVIKSVHLDPEPFSVRAHFQHQQIFINISLKKHYFYILFRLKMVCLHQLKKQNDQ